MPHLRHLVHECTLVLLVVKVIEVDQRSSISALEGVIGPKTPLSFLFGNTSTSPLTQLVNCRLLIFQLEVVLGGH